jgi:hypothetical protein
MGANSPWHQLHFFSEHRYVSPATVLVNRWAAAMAAIQKESSIVLIVLLLARVLIRFLFIWSGSAVDETALNAALIAALVGNFVGRDIRIALRALRLAGGSFTKLSSRSITPER